MVHIVGALLRCVSLPTLYISLGCLLVYNVVSAKDECDNAFKDYFRSPDAYLSSDASYARTAHAKIAAGCQRLEAHATVINLVTTGRK